MEQQPQIQKQQQEPKKQLAGTGALFSRTLDHYGRRFGTFVGIIALPMALSALYAFIAPTQNPETQELSSYLVNLGVEPEIATIIGFIIFPLSFLVSVWGHVALFYAIVNNKLGIIDAYSESWAKLFPFWWVSILLAAVVMGGVLLLIIPGILFAVWLMFAPLLTVTENAKGMEALMRSKKYVDGRWWQVAWRMFAISATLFVVFLAALVASAFAFGFTFYAELMFYIAAAVLTPVASVFLYELYKSLKQTKTEQDLVLNEGDTTTKNIMIAVAVLPVLLILGLVITGLAA